MESGKVISALAAKGFGFIEPKVATGQPKAPDVFFHYSSYPKGYDPTVGDDVAFDTIQQPGKKGPKAINITVVAKATPPTPAAAPPLNPTVISAAASAGPQQPAVADPLNADVEFLYDVNELVSTADHFELPIIVKVTKPGGVPLRLASLALWANRYPISNPQGGEWWSVNQNGEVAFVVAYDRTYDDATQTWGPELKIHRVILNVQVRFGGKELMVSETVPRSQNMQAQKVPPPPAPAPPVAAPAPKAPDPDDLKAEVSAYPNDAGLFEACVTTLASNHKVKGKFSICSSEDLSVFETDGKTSLGTGTEVSLETDGNGTKRFLFGYVSAGQVTVTFKLASGFSVQEPVTKKRFERKK